MLTVDLPPTGSWGTPDMLEEAWMPLAAHMTCTSVSTRPGEGIANLDNIRIGKPLPQSGMNLVVDGGFETGIAGWSSWNGATLSASTFRRIAAPESACHQPAQREPVCRLQPHQRGESNTTYAVSAWVFHTGAANDTVRLAAKIGCASGDTFPWLQNNTAVAPNTWTQLSRQSRDSRRMHGV